MIKSISLIKMEEYKNGKEIPLILLTETQPLPQKYFYCWNRQCHQYFSWFWPHCKDKWIWYTFPEVNQLPWQLVSVWATSFLMHCFLHLHLDWMEPSKHSFLKLLEKEITKYVQYTCTKVDLFKLFITYSAEYLCTILWQSLKP